MAARNIITFFISCLLIVLPWFYGLTTFKHQLVCQLIILGFSFLSFAGLSFRKGPRFYFGTLDSWVLVSLLLTAVYVMISALPYYSLLTFIRFVSVVLLYFLTRLCVVNHAVLERFLAIFVAMGAFYSIYGLLQYYGHLPHAYWLKKTYLASRYVNSGHFAGLLLFPVFSSLAIFFSNRRVFVKIMVCSALLLMLWSMVLTKSRTVWVGMALGLGFFLILMGRERLITPRGFWALIFIVIAGFVLLSWVGGWSVIIERFQKIWDGERLDMFSINHRFNFWRGALNAFLARPWGWGIGTYFHIFPQFRVHSDRFIADYAHNEYFQIAVDFGIPGLIFLSVFMLVYFVRAFIYLNNRDSSSEDKIKAIAFIACIFSLFLACQFDFPLRIYATGLIAAVYLALSVFLYESKAGDGTKQESLPLFGFLTRRTKVFKPLIFILVLGFAVVVQRQLFAQIHYEKGVFFEKNFDWDRAVPEYETAMAMAPFFDEYYEGLGKLYQKRYALAFQNSQRSLFRQKAIGIFEQMTKIHPFWAESHYFLSKFYAEIGEYEKVHMHFEEAVRLDPQNALFVSDFGYFTLESGHVSRALELFENYQRISFKEKAQVEPLETLINKFYQRTQNYEDLKRLISDRWSDHLSLGHVLGAKGHWNEAIEEINISIQQALREYDYQTFMKNVGYSIAEFYVKYRRFHEALAIYEEALRWNTSDEVSKDKIDRIKLQMEPFKVLT